jgi:HAD superfamily hydrolase (TIGR01509 family)
MYQNYKAIIFDLGGVILNLDYNKTIEAFKALGLDDFETMYTQAKQSDLFDRFETGQISSQHFINSLLPYLPKNVTPNQVVHAWNAMILDFPIERLNFLSELNQKMPIYLLSNTNAIHLDAVNRALSKVTSQSLDSFFNKAYYSHEVNLRKPHAEIYDLVCKENGLNKSETLFIDDTIGHIEGAKSYGLNGFHLTKEFTIETLL